MTQEFKSRKIVECMLASCGIVIVSFDKHWLLTAHEIYQMKIKIMRIKNKIK